MKKLYTLSFILLASLSFGQISITAINTPYNQNFDTMGSLGTTFVTGWTAIKTAGTGALANGSTLTMAASNGNTTTGNVYNVGTTNTTDRAFGTLAGGTTIPAFGASFINNSGSLITQVSLSGVIEQWKSGDNAANESVTFSYSTDATSLSTGSWTPITSLNLSEILTTTTTAAAVDGNANKANISSTINLAWTNNSTLWIKWTDANDSGNDGMYAIDDFTFTATATSSAPILLINTPANNATLNPFLDISSNLTVANFTVANGTGDGYIKYKLDDGTAISKYDTTPIVLSGLASGSHTVYVELVDNSGIALPTAVNATVTFTITSSTNAATLAEVRAAGVNAWVNFTGEAFVSFARPTGTTGRNQKYIQDATAGILVDDSAGMITTTFANGDGISGIKGQLINFNGVMEFVPNQNATKSSTGNVITPQVVTLATLAGNIDAYESKLVRINGLTFTAGDGTAAFVVNIDYVINDGGTDSFFRTMFPTPEVDYIGALIPQGAKNITVLVSENNGTLKVVARSLADTNLSVKQNEISGLNMYPNPVTNGNLYISTDSNSAKSVEIYDILGKQVLNTKVSNNTVNVSNLKGGAYIVKINEEGKTATRKLIIE